jgi:hypothetical protein
LRELDEALNYALGAGTAFNINEKSEYVTTIIGMALKGSLNASMFIEIHCAASCDLSLVDLMIFLVPCSTSIGQVR